MKVILSYTGSSGDPVSDKQIAPLTYCEVVGKFSCHLHVCICGMRLSLMPTLQNGSYRRSPGLEHARLINDGAVPTVVHLLGSASVECQPASR